MYLILICISTYFFVSTTFSDPGVQPCHLCEFCGVVMSNGYQFSISDLPERCDEVVYGNYYFDNDGDIDTYMYESDKDSIRSLVAANITVYLRVGFVMYETWSDIFDPQDPVVYNQRMCPLMAVVKELGINGIVFGITNIYSGSTDLADGISKFITKIREDVPTLKFALDVSGNQLYDQISNPESFDFTKTNSVIDMYIIDMTVDSECTSDLLQTGTLITSPDADTISMQSIGCAVIQSTMDKPKMYGRVLINVLKPNSDIMSTNWGTLTQYCNGSNVNSSQWCADCSQSLYDQGAFVKQLYQGISVAWLESDDTKCLCECDKFPATKIIFDGWDNVPLTACPKLDKK